jgi:anion-transporting  ArsA/GET3 family ATPase
MVPTLLPLIESKKVILCAGCGGVGKTTVAAALGLAAARRGKRVLTLTIDPAKRLANSLGLSEMKSEAHTIDDAVFARAGLSVPGELTVMMLDTKQTFDELVTRYASSPEARDRIFENRLYRHLSTQLAGTQEYMAMEKLLAVKEDDRYDLVVLDTPPTRNALDFLDAPARLVQALDGPAIRWFIQAFDRSRSLSFNFLAQGVAGVLRGIGTLTGSGFLEQMAALISDLNDLFGGFKDRADRVAQALRGPDFGYVLVTSPAPLALREVLYFAERLEEQGMRSDAFVINRLHRAPKGEPSEADVRVALDRHGLELGPTGPRRVMQAVHDELALAELDRRHIEGLKERVPRSSGRTFVRIPALPSDIHDVQTLAGVATLLCPPGA